MTTEARLSDRERAKLIYGEVRDISINIQYVV